MRTREPVYWFDREKVDALGYYDGDIPCSLGFSMVHQCSPFEGHPGRCAARTWLNGRMKVEKA